MCASETPTPMPEAIRKLYEEQDRLRAITEDVWATPAAKAAAYRELTAVEEALSNHHA